MCSYKKRPFLLFFYNFLSPQKKHVVCPAVGPAQDEDCSYERHKTTTRREYKDNIFTFFSKYIKIL